MMRWGVRGILAVGLAGLGIWAWHHFFPKPEEVIRKKLTHLAQLASFSGNESAISKVAAVGRMMNECTSDVEVFVDISGFVRQALIGKENLQETAGAVRMHLSGLKVEFLDMNVTLAPNKQSAEVSLTAKIQVPSEREFFPQELKFTMKKVDGDWLVRKIETVRTLN